MSYNFRTVIRDWSQTKVRGEFGEEKLDAKDTQ